jgi:hypothetical protein
MREPQFDRLRSAVGDAVRQPDFSSVRTRAGKVRRRRAVTTAAAFLATVMSVTGLGYAVRGAPDELDPADDPVPTVTESPGDTWFLSTEVTNAGTQLFRAFQRCRDCDPELQVSPDGDSWQERQVPPAPGDVAGRLSPTLTALGPGVVLWRERRILSAAEVEALASGNPPGAQGPADRPWISRNGGLSWRQVVVDTQPVAAVPDGVTPIDCALVDFTCRVGVIDPVTARFAPLAVQPSGITVEDRWTDMVDVPFDGRLWVPGLDPATGKPAVATSSDAGRTWHTHVFTEAVRAPEGTGGPAQPRVAAGPGKVAYVLTYRSNAEYDVHHTTDGGSTWRDGDKIGISLPSTGFVAADGSHIVTSDHDGLVAGRGTGRYAPVTLPRYPLDPGGSPTDPALVQVASGKDGPFLVNSDDGPFLSDDGRNWRSVRLP